MLNRIKKYFSKDPVPAIDEKRITKLENRTELFGNQSRVDHIQILEKLNSLEAAIKVIEGIQTTEARLSKKRAGTIREVLDNLGSGQEQIALMVRMEERKKIQKKKKKGSSSNLPASSDSWYVPDRPPALALIEQFKNVEKATEPANRTGNQVADKIERFLASSPEGLSKNQFHKLFSNHLKAKELQRAISELEELDRVEVLTVETAGRQKKVIRLKGVNPSADDPVYLQKQLKNVEKKISRRQFSAPIKPAKPDDVIGDNVETEDRLLKIEDVMATLKVGRSTIYKLISSGELPGVKVGTSRRILLKDLNNYIENL